MFELLEDLRETWLLSRPSSVSSLIKGTELVQMIARVLSKDSPYDSTYKGKLFSPCLCFDRNILYFFHKYWTISINNGPLLYARCSVHNHKQTRMIPVLRDLTNQTVGCYRYTTNCIFTNSQTLSKNQQPISSVDKYQIQSFAFFQRSPDQFLIK